MKNTPTALFFGAIVLCAVSCKKSQNGAAANGLAGNYKLVNIHAHTYSSEDDIELGTDYRTVTVSDYTSTNNGGGLNITASTMSTVNMTYSVSTNLLGAEFIDGVFQDSLSAPFNTTIPPTSNTSSYKLIGTDSVYFPSGFANSPGGGAVQTIAVGGKYKISGSTLTMTIVVPPQNSTQSAGGITLTSSSSATETITLQKQ